jgi:hypothetical protein
LAIFNKTKHKHFLKNSQRDCLGNSCLQTKVGKDNADRVNGKEGNTGREEPQGLMTQEKIHSFHVY